jgi:hypothetical protein
MMARWRQLGGQDAKQGYGHKARPPQRASRFDGDVQYCGIGQGNSRRGAHCLLKNGPLLRPPPQEDRGQCGNSGNH